MNRKGARTASRVSGRTLPMRVHRDTIISSLEKWPDLLGEVMPDAKNVEEAVAALRSRDREWYPEAYYTANGEVRPRSEWPAAKKRAVHS